MSASPARVVLDTNVCLDLFVFADPRCAALRADLDQGRVEAVTNAACREEWIAVLGYRALALEESARRRAIATFDANVRAVAEDVVEPTPPLPRCVDPDDQKFLLLAAGAGARWLLSRDRALLVLAPRLRRDGRFAILPPQAWTALSQAEVGDGRLDVQAGQAPGPADSPASSAKPV
jgi:predicted nucleic acid-binding protein